MKIPLLTNTKILFAKNLMTGASMAAATGTSMAMSTVGRSRISVAGLSQDQMVNLQA